MGKLSFFWRDYRRFLCLISIGFLAKANTAQSLEAPQLNIKEFALTDMSGKVLIGDERTRNQNFAGNFVKTEELSSVILSYSDSLGTDFTENLSLLPGYTAFPTGSTFTIEERDNSIKRTNLPSLPMHIKTFSNNKCRVTLDEFNKSCDAVCFEKNITVHIVCHKAHICSASQKPLIEMINDDTFLPTNGKHQEQMKTKNNQRNLGVEKWKNCYANDKVLHSLKIGVAIPTSLYKSKQSKLSNLMIWLQNTFAEVNFIYEKQFNVKLEINDIYIPARTGKPSWNKCFDSSALNQLLDFQKWSPVSRQAFWILFDNCKENPTTLGFASLGKACEQYGNWNSGIVLLTDETWLTLAHEVGHLVNASHSFEEGRGETGGIMDYYNNKYKGVYQFNQKYRKAEVCSKFQQMKKICDSTFLPILGNPSTPQPTPSPTPQPTKMCGNGIIDSGERCDCGNQKRNCRFCVNCRLTRRKKCTPDSPLQGQCCTARGFFHSSQKACTTENGRAGYCDRGSCQPLTDPPTPAPTPQPTKMCGNGIIDSGERCDCGNQKTNCKFCVNCRLTRGKRCTPDNPLQGQCCTARGFFHYSQKACTIHGQKGNCNRGKCLVQTDAPPTKNTGKISYKRLTYNNRNAAISTYSNSFSRRMEQFDSAPVTLLSSFTLPSNIPGRKHHVSKFFTMFKPEKHGVYLFQVYCEYRCMLEIDGTLVSERNSNAAGWSIASSFRMNKRRRYSLVVTHLKVANQRSYDLKLQMKLPGSKNFNPINIRSIYPN